MSWYYQPLTPASAQLLSGGGPPAVSWGRIKVGGVFVNITNRKFKVGGSFADATGYKVKVGGTFVDLA